MNKELLNAAPSSNQSVATVDLEDSGSVDLSQASTFTEDADEFVTGSSTNSEFQRGVQSIKVQETSLKTKYGSCNHKERIDCEERKVKGSGEPCVRFSSVQIREYPITLGDNPGGIRGPPLTIEWKHELENTLSLDSYESDRPPRRSGNEMSIHAFDRETMLKNVGFSRSEITQLTKPVNVARNQRKKTNAAMSLDSLLLMAEHVRSMAVDTATLGSRKRRERKFLERFVHSMKGTQ